MTKQEVIDLMTSATSSQDWADKADEVKRACDGYPSFWYSAIVASGLAERVYESFGGSFGIRMEIIDLQ